jgi:chromosome segregation ATPase
VPRAEFAAAAARLRAVATMHSMQEWHDQAQYNMSQANMSHQMARDQMGMSYKAHDDIVSENLTRYTELHTSLATKVRTSQRLIDKLQGRASAVEACIEVTRSSQAHLEEALRAKDAPMQLCTWRMHQREGRPLREQVRDVVEMALEQEKETIAGTQRKLAEAIRATKAQITGLEDKLTELRREINEKTQALGIDEICLRTTQKSFQAQLDKTPPRTPRALSSARIQALSQKSPQVTTKLRESSKNEVYRVHATKSLSHSAALMEESAKDLRSESAKLVQRCEKLVQDATAKSEKAMRDWITQHQAMNKRLEAVIQETIGKIDHTKTTIKETKTQIAALNAPIELTTNCNSWRQQRAAKEHIVDPVTSKLQEHQVTLLRSQEELNAHLLSEKSILHELQERRERLKEDLRDKVAALTIDLNCLGHESVYQTGRRGSETSKKFDRFAKTDGFLMKTRGSVTMPPLTAR